MGFIVLYVTSVGTTYTATKTLSRSSKAIPDTTVAVINSRAAITESKTVQNAVPNAVTTLFTTAASAEVADMTMWTQIFGDRHDTLCHRVYATRSQAKPLRLLASSLEQSPSGERRIRDPSRNINEKMHFVQESRNSAPNPSCSKWRSLLRASVNPSWRMVSIEMQSGGALRLLHFAVTILLLITFQHSV